MTPQIPTETHPSPGAAPASSSWPNAACRSSPGPFGRRPQQPFADPTLSEIGAAHGKPVAQAVLRWLVQREVVIPEDCPRRRMRENIDVFDFALTGQDMTCIAAINTCASYSSHRDPTGGVGVDVSIEAVGYPEPLLTAASLVHPGGTFAQMDEAYDVFKRAAENSALKVVITPA